MSEWREITLGDYIKTNNESISVNYPYKRILYLDTGSITSGRIQKLQEMDLSNAPSRAKRLVRENDIVYSAVRPNQRHFGFMKNPQSNLVVSTGFIVISCDSSQLFPRYLFYYLTSDRSVEYLHSIAEGSTSAYPSLKPTDVETLRITLPPLPEQRAIAEVLSALDDKIDLLHRQNQTLEALAQTLFRQWFIEEVEDDWEEGVLGDLVEFHYGKGLLQSIRTGSGYPVVGSSGIVDFHSEFLIEGPGIVTGRKGTLGKVIYLYENFFPIDTTFYVKTKKDSPNLYFEYFVLKSIGFENMNTDSAVPGLNRNNALSVGMYIPPQWLITKFNNIVYPLFQKLNTNNSQIRTLENLRDTLLPKLMSGEVRVRGGK
jgi:type I restriction enzyme S subunit